MTKNPLINALAALGYIVLVSVIMFYGPGRSKAEDSVLAPIAVLSLLTLSASVMAYVFFFHPIQMFIAGKKQEGMELFVKTTGIFALITIGALFLLLSGVIK